MTLSEEHFFTLPDHPWPLPPQSIDESKELKTTAYDDYLKHFALSCCGHFDNNPRALLQILVAVQNRFGWIPPAARSLIQEILQLGHAEIGRMLAFYRFLEGRFCGQYRILLSSNITDYYAGLAPVLTTLCQDLAVRPGQMRSDARVSLSLVSCCGLSDQGPAALINGWPLTSLNVERARQMAQLIEAQEPFSRWPREWFEVGHSIRAEGLLLERSLEPGEVLREGLRMRPRDLLEQIQVSGLRGRGGAGFSSWQKLNACRNGPQPRYLVCNADEGEPGTFKDRVLLQTHCQQVIEGMTLAAWIIGARQGIIYLRGEYAYLRPQLYAALARRRQTGWLGSRIGGRIDFHFDIEIHLGAGAYVCGEESALLESLEGRPGTPRIRPPFPADAGYLGQPTLVNNVETFACVTQVVRLGAERFAAIGTEASKGTKLHSVSGDCRAPGIYEFPWGISLAELLRACGGEAAIAVQVSGPAGELIPASQFDRRLAFEDIATGGSLMVIGPERDLAEVAANFLGFFAHESCGFCTPCRAGCPQLVGYGQQLLRGVADQHTAANIESLAQLMAATSHCGLGKTAPRALLGLIRHWPQLISSAPDPQSHPSRYRETDEQRSVHGGPVYER